LHLEGQYQVVLRGLVSRRLSTLTADYTRPPGDVTRKSGGQVATVRILVQSPKEALASCRRFERNKILGNLKYLKQIDAWPDSLTLQHPELGHSRTEIIHAYGNMLHDALPKKDTFATRRRASWRRSSTRATCRSPPR
jgi:hypothetical protein